MRVFLISLSFFALATAEASQPRIALVAAPVADVRSASGTLPSSMDYDPLQETQLLYGEPVLILEESGGWARIEATEQPEFSHQNRWQGYPGWTLKRFLVPVRAVPRQNFAVRKRRARLHAAPDPGSDSIALSLGTKLEVPGKEKGGFWKVKKVGGGTGWVRKEDVRLLTPPLPEDFTRKLVLQSALELLGDPYYWGGRSAHLPELEGSVTAVDCSGLVNLAYRVAGIDIPRDSLEQHRKARGIEREDLQPGDLIFSAAKDKPERVSHVALYMGGEKILEAPQSGMNVREIGFKEKYGVESSQARSGHAAGERILYFGTFIAPDPED